MNSELLDIYVLRDSGESMYHKQFGDKSGGDSVLVSSLLATVNMFSADVDTGVSALETENYRFVYHKQNEYLYIARTKKHSDPKFYNEGLKNIANKMRDYLPKKFNGNVSAFESIQPLLEEEFFSKSDEVYEFSGKYARKLEGDALKIYSYLRLKGRADIRTISKMMSIPEPRAKDIAKSLVKNEYLLAR